MSILKDLGKLQKEIIFYLAENPRQHKQAIQKGLKSKHEYGAVLNAVKRLEQTGYLISEWAVSQKKVEIKLYSCSPKGVFYAIARNEKVNLSKVFKSYKHYEIVRRLSEFASAFGKGIFVEFLKCAQPYLPIAETKGVEEAVKQALSALLEKPEEYAYLLKLAERNPKARKFLSEQLKKLYGRFSHG